MGIWMKIKLKEGVKLTSLSPQMVFAIQVAVSVYEECGAEDFVITSAYDSIHTRGSEHYIGHAADLRIWTLPEERRTEATQKLAHRLGPDFDVILEPDHIHVEFDPKS